MGVAPNTQLGQEFNIGLKGKACLDLNKSTRNLNNQG